MTDEEWRAHIELAAEVVRLRERCLLLASEVARRPEMPGVGERLRKKDAEIARLQREHKAEVSQLKALRDRLIRKRQTA